MSRIVKCAHIQASNARHDGTPAEIKEAMIQKHIPLIEEAGKKASQEAKPIDDMRASKAYRTEMIKVLTKRAINMTCERINEMGR